MTRYRVTAVAGYAGHQQGDEIEADLGKNAERWAVENGLLEPVKAKSAKKKPEPEEAGDA